MIGWENAHKIIAVVGGLLGVLSALGGFIYAARGWILARPRVKRIVRSDDDDLEEIWRIHEREFVAEVADEFTDLQRWVDEAAETRKKSPLRLDEFLLCVKAERRVLGYLFAQYYVTSQLVFLSYIAIDTESTRAKKNESEVVIKLFRELHRQLKKQNYQWRGIVGEFEVQKIGHLRPHAQVLMKTFQRTLLKLHNSSDLKTNLYRICIDYRQPVLRPDDVESAVIDASYDQWLVFMPNDPEQILVSGESGKTFIDKSLALNILRLVFLETYFDAFQDDQAYKKYLQAEFDRHALSLPAKVELKSNWKAHEPNEKDKAKESMRFGDGVVGAAAQSVPLR